MFIVHTFENNEKERSFELISILPSATCKEIKTTISTIQRQRMASNDENKKKKYLDQEWKSIGSISKCSEINHCPFVNSGTPMLSRVNGDTSISPEF